jgi:hypothetical protein
MPARFGLIVLAILLMVRPLDASAADSVGSLSNSARRFALLVGCTKYPQLAVPALRGPANDVILMRETLEQRFRFKPENITTLSEERGQQDPRLLPTYANIEREFRNLAQNGRSGDQIVVLLAGHGCQLPQSWSPKVTHFKPEGLDQAFIPADAHFQKENEDPGDDNRLVNVIVDYQLHDWAGAITKSGASLWFIVDSCYSGTMLRGAENVVMRQLDTRALHMQTLIDQARFEAQKKAAATFDGQPNVIGYEVADLKNVVAFYAAQSFEPEYEMPFESDASSPADATQQASASRGPMTCGLLAHTLCRVLNTATAAQPLTYRQLMNRIRLEYARMTRTYPSPCIEGVDADQGMLGLTQWPNQPEFELRKDAEGNLIVKAGKIQGLTEGSILAVLASDRADQAAKPAGYVRIRAANTLFCEVEPCDAGGKTVETKLQLPALCKPERINYENYRIRLFPESVDGPLAKTRRPAPDTIVRQLRDLASRENSIVEIANRSTPDCWRVQVEGNSLYLVAPEGASNASKEAAAVFGPFRPDRIDTEFKEQLERIARVTMLKSLADPPEARAAKDETAVQVEVLIVKHASGAASDKGKIDAGGPAGLILTEGDWVSFRVTNRSPSAMIYVTLLFIDSGYGVQSIYPGSGEIAARLNPGTSFQTRSFRVNTSTIGRENLLTIAVKATGEATDFTSLQQPTIQGARRLGSVRGVGGDNPFDSPLGRLMAYGVYGEGQNSARGLTAQDIGEYSIDLLSWTTQPKSHTASH